MAKRNAPVIGVDIITNGEGAFLLDINTAPHIAIHLGTDKPRNLAPALLDSLIGHACEQTVQ